MHDGTESEPDPDLGPPTTKQQTAIRLIQRNLQHLDVKFTGATKADACLFIGEYMALSKQARMNELISKAAPSVDNQDEIWDDDPELERF